jgi:hypothetical protein
MTPVLSGDLTPVLTQWEMGDLTPVLLQWEMGDLTPVLLTPAFWW